MWIRATGYFFSLFPLIRPKTVIFRSSDGNSTCRSLEVVQPFRHSFEWTRTDTDRLAKRHTTHSGFHSRRFMNNYPNRISRPKKLSMNTFIQRWCVCVLWIVMDITVFNWVASWKFINLTTTTRNPTFKLRNLLSLESKAIRQQTSHSNIKHIHETHTHAYAHTHTQPTRSQFHFGIIYVANGHCATGQIQIERDKDEKQWNVKVLKPTNWMAVCSSSGHWKWCCAPMKTNGMTKRRQFFDSIRWATRCWSASLSPLGMFTLRIAIRQNKPKQFIENSIRFCKRILFISDFQPNSDCLILEPRPNRPKLPNRIETKE